MGPFAPNRFWTLLTAVCALVVSTVSPVRAQSAENVAVVINDNSPDSQRIGEHYVRTRAIPESNVFRIKVSPEETVDRAAYSASIELPIANAIRRAALHDRLLYIVLTKGIPLRIAGATGLSGTVASVDSELTLLYRRMTGQTVAPDGKVDNPYFLADRELTAARPFTHREHDIYLVTRIDAFTVDQALALIDRAQAPSREGRIVLDQIDGDPTKAGNRWLAHAAQRLTEQGHASKVAFDRTAQPADPNGPALGLYSWGATDPAQRRRTTGMKFAPGAIAAQLAGATGRTFKSPPENWTPTGSGQPTTFFEGSSEMLIGDLIRDGITGVSGQVAEPYVLGAVHPEILFPAYLAGFNLAEAFYLATPTLSWTTIVVGDPLCRPFAGQVLTSTELAGALDPRMELPAWFAQRRLARVKVDTPDTPDEAIALSIRGETLLARKDSAGAHAAFEQALKIAPSAPGLLMTLAQLEEAAGAYDTAIARYLRLIEVQPTNVVALNNAAYAIAVRSNRPADALALAKRAVALAPRNASVLDTWGWIEHLLGNHTTAAKILADAITLTPSIGEMHLHAAAIAVALEDRAKAEDELNKAVRLDAALEGRADTRQLRERVAALPIRKPQ